MYGRLVLYHTCNWVFVVFSIAAAVSSNMGMFIVFRFFMGCKYYTDTIGLFPDIIEALEGLLRFSVVAL